MKLERGLLGGRGAMTRDLRRATGGPRLTRSTGYSQPVSVGRFRPEPRDDVASEALAETAQESRNPVRGLVRRFIDAIRGTDGDRDQLVLQHDVNDAGKSDGY